MTGENKKQNTDSLTGLSGRDRMIVQKSNPLIALWKSDLTLPAFKILDIYLARINTHYPEQRTVTFQKGELEEVLGVDRIKPAELRRRLDQLMMPVELPTDDPDNKVEKVNLFEYARATRDECGLWMITLKCTPTAVKFFFNIENLGYIRYKLKFAMTITSRYSYILFQYLEQHRRFGIWEESLDSLREILSCHAQTYQSFKRFKNLILDRIQSELLEKTDCEYTYTPVRRGRKVVAVRFQMIPKLVPVDLPNPIEADISQQVNEVWEIAVEKYHFSREQLEELRTYLITVPGNLLPDCVEGPHNLMFQLHAYLAQKVATMERQAAKKSVGNKYAYLLSMVKHDVFCA